MGLIFVTYLPKILNANIDNELNLWYNSFNKNGQFGKNIKWRAIWKLKEIYI